MATIGTSIAAVSASNYLTINNEALTKSIKRLSSGSRLADPVDDAAGVAVSGNLDARIKRLAAAVEGAQNVVSYGQTVDGFLNTLQGIVTRMSELAQRATNGAFSSADRSNYDTEYATLTGQLTNIVAKANFNNTTVFAVSSQTSLSTVADLTSLTPAAVTVAIDASANTDQLASAFALNICAALGLIITGGTTSGTNTATSLTSISNISDALVAVVGLTNALGSITTARAQVNADISKFNFYISNIRNEKVNVEAANSRIKDLNVADESTNQAKQSILVQAATAMLAQANTTQNVVLQLLQR